MSDGADTGGTLVGPYLLAECIGRGGMGQVFRAFDRRLERWVAVKQIRPHLLDRPEHRQRLLGEARAAAALGHRAIVQIHDLLETPEGDWIVMEWVAGRTLAELVAEGPLPLAHGLGVAQTVAEGLAAAHDRGVLHRDLKTENVIVAPTGEAKILDFGIAQRLDASTATVGRDLEESGAVLGTFRAMSPEQSRGRPLDPRSDLFSLGVLLYEVFTGRSPFRDEDPLRTLERVRTHQQPALDTVDPELPAGLVRLVDRLLEKNPARRPPSAQWVVEALDELGEALRRRGGEEGPLPATGAGWEATHTRGRWPASGSGSAPGPVVLAPTLVPALVVFTVVLAVVFSTFAIWPGVGGLGRWAGRGESLYVAVAEPRPTPGGVVETFDALRSAVRSAVVEGLLSLEGVAPLTSEGLEPLPETARQLGRAMASDEVVESFLQCGAEVCQLELRRIRTDDGRVVWIDLFDVPNDEIALLTTAVVGRLQGGYGERGLRAGVARLEVDPEVYARFLELRRADLDRTLEPAEVLRALAALRHREPRFLELHRLEAKVAFDRFFYSREESDLERALDLLDAARRIEPDDPRILYQWVSYTLHAGRPEAAAEALDRLERLEPGDARLERSRAILLELRGETDEALEVLRRSTRRHPSWRALFELASMEYRQGHHGATRRTLERLLEQSPDHYDASSFLAQLELLEGDPRRSVELYQQLVDRAPGPAELSNLALAHLLLGELDAAEQRFAQVLATTPENPFFLLNLADVRHLLGRRDEARQLYGQVLERVAADPTEGSWQLATVEGQALAHLGRSREAVAAVQRALQLAPDNTQVAYEASLVYAVIGETTSALVHAERALAELDPRWFSLPWFDPLRRDPRFETLLASS